jgi:hypothetical protein
MTLPLTPIRLALYSCLALFVLIGNSHSARQEPATRHVKFQWIGSGKTIKKGGVEVSFGRFRSEDGVLVERFVEDYRTHDAAFAELARLRRRASKVSQDGYKTDALGKRVGPRVVLVFGRPSDRPEHTVVAWTDGPKIFLLRSESRSILLDFEEQDYPAVQPRSIPKRP